MSHQFDFTLIADSFFLLPCSSALWSHFFSGHIGSIDVADMVHCTQDALMLDPSIDPDKVAVVGGSHGGKLVCPMDTI